MAEGNTFILGSSPLVVTAIHDGHDIRPGLLDLFNLNESERLREEDPFTGKWTNISDNSIVVHHSRFETDVNRPREKAVYQLPEDAWGLNVWRSPLPHDVVNGSLNVYDRFYRDCETYFDSLFKVHEKLVVYDIHSYNHRRESPDSEADPRENPEINIGTKNMDRELWDPVVHTLTEHFRSFTYGSRHLGVGENVKFKGGYFGKWLFDRYGKHICPISIEFKKFFMDEWTGKPFEEDIRLIRVLLERSRKPVLNALKTLTNKNK